MKKEMERAQKDIKGLEATIFEYKFCLKEGREDDLSNSRTEGAMAITPAADDAPPANTTPKSLTSPLDEEQAHNMEVNNGDEHQTARSFFPCI